MIRINGAILDSGLKSRMTLQVHDELVFFYDQNGLRTFAVVLDKGDEVREGLLEFANTNRFADAHLTGIGGFSEVTLGFFDPQQKTYKKIPINQ